jgi:hypothetical protein
MEFPSARTPLTTGVRLALLAACLLATGAGAAKLPAAPGAPGAAADASFVPPPSARIQGLVWESKRGAGHLEQATVPEAIHLSAGYELDPSGREADGASLPPELRAAPPAQGDRGAFLLHFGEAIQPGDRDWIESMGGAIVAYIPERTFLVRMDGAAFARASGSARIAWSGLYHPAYKISPQPELHGPGEVEAILLLFPDAEIDGVERALQAAGGSVLFRSDNGINKILRARVDSARLDAVARISDVQWIEPYLPVVLHNNECQWVVQTNLNNNRRIWNMGIHGEGQVISLSDTGLRTSHRQFFDAAVPIATFGDYPTHRKVIAYHRTFDYNDIIFGEESYNAYHGTHTSGTAGGNDAPNGTDNRDGMPLEAKIYFLDGGGFPSAGIYVPPDLNDLMIQPYNGNAGGVSRIMTNSWGISNGGAYDVHSMTADQFMWNHPDFLAFFSNGNDGGPNTVGSPATAKNVVSAGGTANGVNATGYYTSTSRGPTDDGRIKPTICAPAALSSALGSGDTGYTTLYGTSMASPAMAGATVLVRQYLAEGWYPTGTKVPGNAITAPSASLMKAIAINSADPNVGSFVFPDNNIGWGRIDIDNALYFSGDARRLALVEQTEGLSTGDFIEYQVYVASNAIPLKASLVWTDYPGNPSAGVQLVNNLNLSATDGVNTYKGNVYSSGQSQTGGTADALNVEENVQRNSPTVGLWTIRVEAANVALGPQPYSLVITGGLASDAGIVAADKATYGGNESMAIRVVDLNAGPTIQVTVTSTTEPSSETVSLPGVNGVYQGALLLATTYPQSQNGELSVSDGDLVTVTYQDANPVGTITTTAQVDLDGPVITNVGAAGISESSASITWTSSSGSTSKVYYGLTPALGDEESGTGPMAVDHAVTLLGLIPDQTYYFDVESADPQGNSVRADNGGSHYRFSTDRNRDVVLVIGDSTFDKKVRYTNAFAQTGWTNTIWEGAQASAPYVGDIVAGLASFKAVVLQPGLEQYPALSDAARTAVTDLMDLGGRLAIFSHDVAWDFCAISSPDYTVERCAWFEEELKSRWQTDPTTFSLVRGLAGDPISGAYTAGISYTPHRDGAAGDEVDGLPGNGTFSYVWRDNDTSVDDIAIRWTGNSPVGVPGQSVWAGTPNKVSSNYFELAHVNAGADNDPTRADVLDKTLIWLIGHDHPDLDLTAPNGGEVFTGNTISVTWTESSPPGFAIASRAVSYSDDGGISWNVITNAAGPSPYIWNVASIPNGTQYRVRVVALDNGSPVLSGSDRSAANFTINRPGGDTRGPVVVAGSITVDPNPILVPDPATLTATATDAATGNSNIAAMEWSKGPAPAPAGTGTPMSGAFDTQTETGTAALDSEQLTPGSETLWVRARDAANQWGNASALTVVVNAEPTAVEEGGMPLRFALREAAPNPFNPVTAIRYDLPQDARVRLSIHDVTGRRVRTLVDGVVGAGSRVATWDGRDEKGRSVGSGIFFCSMEAGGFRAVKKVTLLK